MTGDNDLLRCAFTVRGLDLFYEDTRALYDINLNIPKHKITAFIGPSGCGKSTFLRCFNRMNDEIPNCKVSGSILLENEDINKISDTTILRRQVGMVFQKPAVFPMTIYENVAFAPRTYGIHRKSELDSIVEKSLRSAALWDEVNTRLYDMPESLSGGQQQRLCIARCLAASPRVLLMDEPTSALDPIATSKIEDLLFSLKESLTIIIVTHNMQQAVRISDRTAFFLMGHLIEEGETKELFTSPREKRTYDYISGRFG